MKTLELNETAGGMIADFGEKIHGARKDTWKQYADTMATALPEFSQITLSKHFPEPDYAAAIERGACPENLAMIKALRDIIPPKPRREYKLARWGALVTLAHGIAQRMAAAEFKMTPARMDEILQATGGEIAGKVKLYRRLGFPLFLKADGWTIRSGDFGRRDESGFGLKYTRTTYASKSGCYQSDLRVETPDDKAGWEAVFNLLKAKLQAEIESENEGTPGGREIKFNLYSERRTGEIFIGKKGLRDVIRLKTGFKTAKEAREYLASSRAELETKWETLRKAPQLRKAANLPRIGTDRRAGNITPDAFAAAFGFRGVQFGNYVEGDRRQSDLNESHDAFLDMAAALGLPARSLALSGGLGMAFGARGRGGDAVAHFEPLQFVINITKTRGPGSLAHEWFHALDNYLARVNDTGRTDTRAAGYLSAAGLASNHLTPATVAAFVNLRKVLSTGDFSRRSDEYDCTRAKAYWGTTIEKAARAFEIYISDKLAAAGVFNDYVANIYKTAEAGPYPTADEMSGGIAAAYDAIFNALKSEPVFNA